MRVERIGAATLYHARCEDVLPTLGRFDAVVTDPPYNSGLKYGAEVNDNRDDYWLWLKSVVDQCQDRSETVCVKHSALKIGAFIEHIGFRRILVWSKPFSSGFPLYGVATHWEPIHWLKGKSTKWSKDVFECNVGNTNAESTTGHPAQMPEALGLWLVDLMSPPNGAVFDPFMGSGTTGVACARMGRAFTGIEVNGTYFDIACRRIEAAHKQADLFIEPPAPKPEQPDIFECRFLPHGEQPAAGEAVHDLRGHHAAYSRLAVRAAAGAERACPTPAYSSDGMSVDEHA